MFKIQVRNFNVVLLVVILFLSLNAYGEESESKNVPKNEISTPAPTQVNAIKKDDESFIFKNSKLVVIGKVVDIKTEFTVKSFFKARGIIDTTISIIEVNKGTLNENTIKFRVSKPDFYLAAERNKIPSVGKVIKLYLDREVEKNVWAPEQNRKYIYSDEELIQAKEVGAFDNEISNINLRLNYLKIFIIFLLVAMLITFLKNSKRINHKIMRIILSIILIIIVFFIISYILNSVLF